MGLKEDLLRGIFSFGYEKPSAIQQQAIVPCCKGLISTINETILTFQKAYLISGRDVIAQAQSGTGKTATFSISVLQRICDKSPRVQALVMAPTRELAQQVAIAFPLCLKR